MAVAHRVPVACFATDRRVQPRAMVSEAVLRQAALACYENAESLHEEAKLLAEHGFAARAVALAIIGLEEFAKATVYTLAALHPHEREVLLAKLPTLNVHEVKHLIAGAAEYAQIVSREYVAVLEQESGESMSPDGYLATLFGELSERGLAHLIGTRSDARAYYRELTERLEAEEARFPGPRYIPDVESKNAALYVDLTPDGELLTPDRVEPYVGREILGLEWFFSQYGVLPQILKDDARWERFAARFRS